MNVRGLALVLSGWVVVAGCEGSPPAVEAVASLHFTTEGSLPDNPPPDVDITLADATKARAIYTATLELPGIPPGIYSCPAGWGVVYKIAFLDAATNVTGQVVLEPTGCRTVTISGTSPRRALDDGYWAALAENLGIEESKIYPYRPPGI